MNQFYRALHMPPKRLLRKVMGEKEIYTIAVRPRPTAEGTEPLPALEGGPYTLLPRREGWWFADPRALEPRAMLTGHTRTLVAHRAPRADVRGDDAQRRRPWRGEQRTVFAAARSVIRDEFGCPVLRWIASTRSRAISCRNRPRLGSLVRLGFGSSGLCVVPVGNKAGAPDTVAPTPTRTTGTRGKASPPQ